MTGEKPAGLSVRLAREDDRERLAAAYAASVNPDRREADRFARLHVSFERCLLVEEGGVVLGGLTWGTRDDPRAGVVEITGLAIHEKVRRQGLGTLLVLLALEDMEAHLARRGGKLRRVFTLTDERNAVARKLYEKVGFRAVAQLAEHLRAGRADFVLALHPGRPTRLTPVLPQPQ